MEWKTVREHFAEVLARQLEHSSAYTQAMERRELVLET
jgi:hypothetical protein